jgi:hypothetical protein
MGEIGTCIYCGSSMWRDDYGRVHARNPEPGCLCSARPQDRYTVDKPLGVDTWFLWEGDPEVGEVVATGSLKDVCRKLERLEHAG